MSVRVPPPPPPSELSKDELEKLRKQTEMQWVNKNNVKACSRCKKSFSYSWKKKRCKNCGDVVCTECSKNNLSLPEKGFAKKKPVRVCVTCYEKIVGFPSSLQQREGHSLLSHSHHTQGIPRIMYASTSRHGLREDNEDRICVDIKWSRDDADDTPKFMAFFGVFDGHSGSDTSQHLKERLPADILTRIRQGQLSKNEISHLHTMSQSSRRKSSRKKRSHDNSSSSDEKVEEEGESQRNALASATAATAAAPHNSADTARQLTSLFEDPEPSISHIDSNNGEETKQQEEFPSLMLSIEPVTPLSNEEGSSNENGSGSGGGSGGSGGSGSSGSSGSSGGRLSDSLKAAPETEYNSKSRSNNNNTHTNNNNNNEEERAEGRARANMNLAKIVQYSCLHTDYLYGQNQLKKPNSERSHSGSCAVFVVFTNAKLSSSSGNNNNNSRLRDAFKWFRKTSDSEKHADGKVSSSGGGSSNTEKSVNSRNKSSRNEREKSISRTFRDALSPRVSPKSKNNAQTWNSTPMPSEQLLASPSVGGVIPWIFARGSKSRPFPCNEDSHTDLSVVCASVGDSEIVMHERGQNAVSLFPKHNWTDAEEEKRVKERGGEIREQHGVKRICVPGTLRPTLAVSRSFGDVAFKKGAAITKSKKINVNFFRGSESTTLKEDLVVCAPAIKDISSYVSAGELNLLVLASDGLWDMFGHKEAIDFIETELNEHFSKREARKKQNGSGSKKIVQEAPSRKENEGGTGDTHVNDLPPAASTLPSNPSAISSPVLGKQSSSSSTSAISTTLVSDLSTTVTTTAIAAIAPPAPATSAISIVSAPPPPPPSPTTNSLSKQPSLTSHPPPPPPLVAPARQSSASSLSSVHAPPPPPPLLSSNNSLSQLTSSDASLVSTTPKSTSSAPPPPPLTSTTTTTIVTAPTMTHTRGGRAASMVVQNASTIVIHRPPGRRRSESFSTSTTPFALNAASITSSTSLLSASTSSCPPTPNHQNTQANDSAKNEAAPSTSTYPPPPPSVTSSTSPIPLAVSQTSPLTVTTPPSPTSHIHVTFASSPQYYDARSPPISSQGSAPGTPSSSIANHPPFSPGTDGFLSAFNANSMLSPSYTMASPSYLSTHNENDDGSDLLPEITDRELDKGSGGEFPSLVTIISPDLSDFKTPNGKLTQPHHAWTDPAPSRQLPHHSAHGASLDDSKVDYVGGLDAEELEDWAALQRICDKLADAAVKRMESQPNLEGDNVSVVIVYFPS